MKMMMNVCIMLMYDAEELVIIVVMIITTIVWIGKIMSPTTTTSDL
jgi:hypothetical protein